MMVAVMEATWPTPTKGEPDEAPGSSARLAGSASLQSSTDLPGARHEVGAEGPLPTTFATTDHHTDAGPSDEPFPASIPTDNRRGPMPEHRVAAIQGDEHLASAPGADGGERAGVTDCGGGADHAQYPGAKAGARPPGSVPAGPEQGSGESGAPAAGDLDAALVNALASIRMLAARRLTARSQPPAPNCKVAWEGVLAICAKVGVKGSVLR